MTGRRIGVYEVEALLGAGGMGEVYRARDTKLNRPVAIKFLAETFSDARASRRFQREAESASSLNHPHILTVHDIGEFEGRQYLVTEFVDGGTLRAWAEGERRPWRQIVELLRGVADGLAAAHAAGVVHRDLKPENVLVADSGYAKLADFGLAKLFEHSIAGPGTPTLTVTTPGTIVGTVAYMSPEQASGRPVDARSDIFSFGVMLYELLAGRRPFTGATSLEVLERLQHQPPPPLSETTPVALRAVVEKALEKEPADRYQSMQEMSVDLRRVVRQTSDVSVPSPARLSFARLAIVTVLLLLVIGAFATWWARVNRAVGPQIRSIAVLPFQNFSRDPEQEFFADGTTDALISSLARIHALDVTSRTSVMRYKSTTTPLPQIARELGVDALVLGSVQRSGGRVLVTAQLVRASTDTHLWANTYDRDVADWLRLQSDITQAIAREIQITVAPEEAVRLARTRRVRPEAQEAYMQGKYHYFKGGDASVNQAIEFFKRSIDLQPDYAEAYAGLALAWDVLYTSGRTHSPGESRSAALKALELDPDLAEAHAAVAVTNMNDWKWEEADREFRRARELNPNSLDICACYASFLSSMGRTSEALTVIAHAAKVNPLSALVEQQYGAVLHMAGRHEEALRHFLKALELEPQDAATAVFLSWTYAALGRFEDAIAQIDPPEWQETPWLGVIYARAGRREDALRLAAGGSTPSTLLALSFIYFALGDLDRGFELLTRMVDERMASARFFKVQPDFGPAVRSDPRFQALVARLKIPDPVQ